MPFVDLFLNPSRKAELDSYSKLQLEKYQKSYSDLKSYDSFFELLWYSGNPCYDIQTYTSDYKDQKSIIKQCQWKGNPINCSAIFKMSPTDNGMCCVFSFKEESVFSKSKYSDNLDRLQKQDKIAAFDSSVGKLATPPGNYYVTFPYTDHLSFINNMNYFV